MATELEQKLDIIYNEKNNKIIPANIKKGIKIFDVEGTYGADTSDADATTSGGTISAVDSSIDANLLPENIKAGITILGVTGTYTGETTNEVN